MAQATVPGRNGLLLFETTSSSPGEITTGTIYSIKPDGKNLIRLSPGNVSEHDPAFSPDGASLAFLRRPSDQVWVRPLASAGAARQLTVLGEFAGYCCIGTSPVFEPQRKSILYGWSDPFDSGLRRVSTAGGDPVVLGSWHGTDLDTAVSPDGRHVAIVAGRYPERRSIHILSRDGRQDREVHVGDKLSAIDPTYSPDGTRIAFAGWETGTYDPRQIYSVSTDGSDLVKLTDRVGGADHPVFSPDGRKIAFSDDGIFKMNANGSKVRKVYEGSSTAILGDWQSRRVVSVRKFNSRTRILKLRFFASGRVHIRGKGIRPTSARVRKSGVKALRLKPKRWLQKRIRRRGKSRVVVRVCFTPTGALPKTLKRKFILRTR